MVDLQGAHLVSHERPEEVSMSFGNSAFNYCILFNAHLNYKYFSTSVIIYPNVHSEASPQTPAHLRKNI
jgi:hypothetical protein